VTDGWASLHGRTLDDQLPILKIRKESTIGANGKTVKEKSGPKSALSWLFRNREDPPTAGAHAAVVVPSTSTRKPRPAATLSATRAPSSPDSVGGAGRLTPSSASSKSGREVLVAVQDAESRAVV